MSIFINENLISDILLWNSKENQDFFTWEIVLRSAKKSMPIIPALSLLDIVLRMIHRGILQKSDKQIEIIFIGLLS